MQSLSLTILPGEYAVWRLAADAPLPDLGEAGFFSITRTPDETSVVSLVELVPDGVSVEAGWCCIQVSGPLEFSLTGVLASLAAPLANAGISIFTVSTYDTDYLLVKRGQLRRARRALEAAGHVFVE